MNFPIIEHRPLTWRDRLADDRTYKWPALIGSAIVCVLLITGCGSVPFIEQPRSGIVCTNVQFVSESEIRKHCPPDTDACATVGRVGVLQSIYAPLPKNWSDYDRIYYLGHELLHNLGATH